MTVFSTMRPVTGVLWYGTVAARGAGGGANGYQDDGDDDGASSPATAVSAARRFGTLVDGDDAVETAVAAGAQTRDRTDHHHGGRLRGPQKVGGEFGSRGRRLVMSALQRELLTSMILDIVLSGVCDAE